MQLSYLEQDSRIIFWQKTIKSEKYSPSTWKFLQVFIGKKMSQNQLISSYTNTNINHDTNSSNSSSSPTMQDLMMSLLIDRSKVISSLQRTIEGLNDTIKALNNNVEKLEASRCTENVDKEVDKEVSKDVTQVFEKATVTVTVDKCKQLLLQ